MEFFIHSFRLLAFVWIHTVSSEKLPEGSYNDECTGLLERAFRVKVFGGSYRSILVMRYWLKLFSVKSEFKKLFFVKRKELELWSWKVSPFAWQKKIWDRELMISFLKPYKGPQEESWNTFPFWQWFYSFRRCSTCKKKRSLRTNSFFAKWPKIPLGELLMMIYFWSMDQTRKSTARMMSINNNLVCTVFRSLEDACSADIATNPFTPFGGTAVVKCDESKFNHKAKVSLYKCSVLWGDCCFTKFGWILWQLVSLLSICYYISTTEGEELPTCGSLESFPQPRGLLGVTMKWWRVEIVRRFCRFLQDVCNRAVKCTPMTGGPTEIWNNICQTTSVDIALLSTQIISLTQ